MKNNTAIKIENISKTFALPHQKPNTLKGVFTNPFKRYDIEVQDALSDISFEVNNGEFFGIVGRNGCGKSTLLKCIAGVYAPDSGSIEVNGSMVPFIELGVGFNSDLSGRDNVYLNGSLLGFSRPEIDELYDSIVEFAELEDFMDQKLRNYSSGMQVRLAFSIAIRANSDILLLDEVLAVGDAAFKKKCNDYFFKLKNEGRTIILVSHSMSSIEQYCDRAALIEEGRLIDVGDPSVIADKYNELNFRSTEKDLKKLNTEKKNELQNSESANFAKPTKAKIVDLYTYSTNPDTPQNTFSPKEKISVRYVIEGLAEVDSPIVGIVFRDKMNNRIFASNTQVMNVKLDNLDLGDRVAVDFCIDNIFDNTSYSISGAVSSHDKSEIFHRLLNVHVFDVGGWKMLNSFVNPPHSITTFKL